MGKTKIKTVDLSENQISQIKSEDIPISSGSLKKNKAAQKQGQPKYRSKKYLKAAKMVDRSLELPLNEAVELAQKTSYAKFKGSIEAHINTTVKGLRGNISLPHLSGRELKILVFTGGSFKNGDPDITLGNDQILAGIEKGKIDFDVIIATPDWMPKLAKVAKVLGPRGLMPNPKNNTVTDNIEKAISELKGGKTEYKSEPSGKVIHLGIGKVEQSSEEIAANIKVLYNAIGKSKIKKITLAPTMGPGVKVQLSSI